jgi:2-polyprenyl-6-methoxyphenol hydroxylase-like FAD-dependent oxidoreductase
MAGLGEHAVVLGASMAGLMSARVLADHFDRVTLVDRDAMPQIGVNRRGVPQGRHLHGLHPRGREILEELFPGITAELVAAGAPSGDVLGNLRWQLAGHRFRQPEIGLVGLFGTRPFLEGHVRARIRALPGVRFAERTDVVGLATTADRAGVTGVRVQRNDCAAAAEELAADLVVDATGRGSRTPRWLDTIGYARPAEDRVEIDLGYATRHYRLAPGALGADLAVLTSPSPECSRGAMLATTEGGRYTLTAWGICGDHPPTDPDGFEYFLSTLLFPDIAQVIRNAEPLDDPVAFRFPVMVRRRYERLPSFPERLLVIGDAICSFDPVYGQGVTVAAAEAMALRKLLAAGRIPTARRYFRALAPVIDVPWDIAVGGDLAYPSVPGKRTAKIRLVNAYLARLQAAAVVDPSLAEAFVRVVGMIDRPERLLRPDRGARVLLANLRRPPAPPDPDLSFLACRGSGRRRAHPPGAAARADAEVPSGRASGGEPPRVGVGAV